MMGNVDVLMKMSNPQKKSSLAKKPMSYINKNNMLNYKNFILTKLANL